VKCAARGLLEMQDPKNRQKFAIWAPLHIFIMLYLCNLGMCRQSEKNLLNISNISPTYPHNMANFVALTAEIGSLVWGGPANFNCFCVFAALLHGTLVVVVSQTLRR